MPIYEFHCQKCEKDSEILVRSTKWKGTRCPVCGSSKLTKKLSVFSSSAVASGADALPCGGDGSGACGCRCAAGRHKH